MNRPEAVARRCSLRKMFLRNFTKVTGEHQSLLRSATLFSKKLTLGIFLGEFCEISKHTFFQNTSSGPVTTSAIRTLPNTYNRMFWGNFSKYLTESKNYHQRGLAKS